MCDPFSIIGAVASVAASAIAANQQQQYIEDQNQAQRDAYQLSLKARQAEIGRQDEFQNEAETGWRNTVTDLTAEKHAADQAAAEKEFMENYNAMDAEVKEGFLLSGQDQANETIKTEIAKRANTAAADARERVAALASLSSYGTVDLNRSIALNENANFLSTLGGKRRGSLGVSQQEQNISPVQISPPSSILSDIVSGAGGVISSVGQKFNQPKPIAPATIY
jgi:hypothetical protein